MTYVRGLDGLRAVAVIAVLAFHAEVPFATGGFLGVSLFFTLSGFLITSLLLGEFDRSGTVSFRRFYSRRVRRLLPAAYACLLGVAALSLWWSASQQRSLRGDLVASVANVANWRFAFAPSNYEDLFLSEPSPLAHFWSLAIEEQIYLLLPLVVLAAMRRGPRTLAGVTVIATIASVAATLLTSDRDLVYNGTHTRVAELLVGVGLAQIVAHRPAWITAPMSRRGGWLPGAIGSAAMLALIVFASLDQPWLYRGGLAAVSLASGALIVAVLHGRFPTRLLEVAPLVAIGAVSYGIYLYHWPVFLLLDGSRTGLSGVPLLTVRCAVTALLTIASYRLLEQPIRTGRVANRDRVFAPVLGVGVIAVVAAAVLVVPTPALTPTQQLLALGEQDVVEFTLPPVAEVPAGLLDPDSAVDPRAGESTPTTEPPRPRVAIVGSEPAAVTALEGSDMEVVDALRPGCPLTTASSHDCPALSTQVAEIIAGESPDVVVVATGAAEDAELVELRQQATTPEQLIEYVAARQDAMAEIVLAIDETIAANVPIIIFANGNPSFLFNDYLVRVALVRPTIAGVMRTPDDLLAETRSSVIPSAPSVDDSVVLRVAVIGDSTSLNMARALNDGGDGRLAVLWAGANGCPFAPVDASRSSRDTPWQTLDCVPYEQKLPALVEEFDADVVLLVVGPTELAELRFPGDPHGYVAGDDAFDGAREAALERLLGVVEVPLLVADVPSIRAGGFATPAMTDRRRLDALNSQVLRWDARWPQVSTFDYRGPLERAEAASGGLRSDGVHPDAEPLEALARSVYVDQLIGQTARVRAEIAAAPD